MLSRPPKKTHTKKNTSAGQRRDHEALHTSLPDHDRHATLQTLKLTHGLIQVTEYYMITLTIFTKEKRMRIRIRIRKQKNTKGMTKGSRVEVCNVLNPKK